MTSLAGHFACIFSLASFAACATGAYRSAQLAQAALASAVEAGRRAAQDVARDEVTVARSAS